jgi:beta-xylosidase
MKALNELIKQMSYNRDRALGAEKDAYNICILYAENMLEKLETLKTNNKMKKEMEHKNPLTNPAEHTLQELFAELKFGRPAASQEYLDKCIAELNEQEA